MVIALQRTRIDVKPQTLNPKPSILTRIYHSISTSDEAVRTWYIA